MRRLTTNIRQIRGFSLVEILITTVVLGAGLVGAAKFQGNIIKSSSLSEQRVQAVNIARNLIESNIQIVNGAQFETLVGAGTTSDTISGDTTSYNTTLNVVKSDNTRGADINVKVSWGDGQEIVLSTVVSNSTPNLLTLSEQAPSRSVITDKLFIAQTFPAVNPSNPSNAENICRCSAAGVAIAMNQKTKKSNIRIAQGSGKFIKVSNDDGNDDRSDDDESEDDGGGISGGWWDSNDDGSSIARPVAGTSANAECTICCAASVAAAASNSINNLKEKYYAQLEADFIKKIRYGGDQVVNNNTFDMRYLIKGYQTKRLDHDLKTYLHRIGGNDDGGSGNDDGDWSGWNWGTYDDDGGSGSATEGYVAPTFSFSAACGITYVTAPSAQGDPIPAPEPILRCIYYRGNS